MSYNTILISIIQMANIVKYLHPLKSLVLEGGDFMCWKKVCNFVG